jgi:Tfp pilus assembly protein PilN
MINLLPPSRADRIRYGRHNAMLLKWLIGSVVSIVCLAGIVLAGGHYIDTQANNLQRDIDFSSEQLKTQNLTQVQKDAKQINSNIKVINQVLSQEIRFSDLIQAIGQVMPSGTVLSSLSLNKINGAIDLKVSARDYNSAVQVTANLSDPKNNLFDSVDIININCTSNQTLYKCGSSYKALFSKSAQNRFLSVSKENSL